MQIPNLPVSLTIYKKSQHFQQKIVVTGPAIRVRYTSGSDTSARCAAHAFVFLVSFASGCVTECGAVQVLLNNGAGGLNAAMAANKKQREVYVGNLVIGGITDLMLRELFNAALAHFVAGAPAQEPVHALFLSAVVELVSLSDSWHAC